jgi:hypothetical protein
VRRALQGVARGAVQLVHRIGGWFGPGDDQIGPQEVTLYTGLGLFFCGVGSQFDWPAASIITGAVMMGLGWPRCAADPGGSSTTTPSSRPAAAPRSRG